MLKVRKGDVIPIHQAKTNFSQLIKRAVSGETILIGGYGKPEVILKSAESEEEKNRAAAELRKKAWGCMRGRIDKETIEKLTAPTSQEIIDSFYSMQGLEDFEVK